MQGSLGEKIGEGEFADVHAWAPGQVLKLWKEGVRQRTVLHEARMIRAVFAAGFPAPEVFGEVTLDGRFGIVLTLLDGPTLGHLSRTGAMTFPSLTSHSRFTPPSRVNFWFLRKPTASRQRALDLDGWRLFEASDDPTAELTYPSAKLYTRKHA
jgi:hypothetical protein